MRHTTQPVVGAHSLKQEQTSIFLLFLLFALFFNFNYLLGPYALVRIHDTFDTDLPHYVIQGKFLLKYGFFGWYPNFAGGMPSFISQHPPYYILSLVSAFMPLWLTYEILSVSYMALAGYGMFRLLQLLFKMDRRIAIWGGILFIFGNAGNISIVINEVFNFLFPIFVVWSIELCQYRLSFFGRGLRVLGLLFISLLSYPVITLPFFPILHFVLVLAYAQPRENLKRLILQTILIWTSYVLLFVPHFYALYDYIPFSHRNYICAYHDIFYSIRALAYNFIHELLRHHAAPLFICGLPLLWSSRNFRLSAVILASYVGIFSFFESPFRWFFVDSFLMKMDPAHFSLCINVILCISASLFVAETLSLRMGRLSIVVCVIAFAVPFLPIEFSDRLIQISGLVMGLSLLSLIRRGNNPKSLSWQDYLPAWLLFMSFVIALAIMGMAGKQTDFVASQPYARLYSNHPELNLSSREDSASVFRVGTVDILPGVAQSYGLETINAKAVLFNKYYKQFFKGIIFPQLKQNPEDEKFFDTYWIDLSLTAQSSSVHPPSQRPVTSWNIPLLLMVNTKYLISKQPIIGIEPFIDLNQKIDGIGLPFKFLKNTKVDNLFKMPLYLYRFKETFSRGYLVKTPIILNDRQAVMSQLTKQSISDLRKKVFFTTADLPQQPGPKISPTMTGATDDNPDLIEVSPDRLVFKGNLKSPAILVISNNYDPHWFAWVNGQPSPIYRANIAFQSVFINQTGPFRVVLEYHHPVIWWLHLVSILGIVLFIASAWIIKGGKTFLTMPPACPHPQNSMGKTDIQKRAKNQYRWLGLMGGVTVSILYAAYLIYVILALPRLPNSALIAVSLGRNIYLLAVVPLVGILLSIWMFLCEGKWHLFSINNSLADSPLPDDLSEREGSSPLYREENQ